MTDDNPAQAVRQSALIILARREHSAYELQQKLADRFPELDQSEFILPVISRLQAEKLQSDARFVESYVRYRSTRGIGPIRITAELHPKRVEAELARTALYETGIDWSALCLGEMGKKFRSVKHGDLRERARVSRFLQQRGFSFEHIRDALRARGISDADALTDDESG